VSRVDKHCHGYNTLKSIPIFNHFVRFKKKIVFFLKGLYMKCDIDMTALADEKHCFEEMCYNF
jgi:hypothetical protein